MKQKRVRSAVTFIFLSFTANFVLFCWFSSDRIQILGNLPAKDFEIIRSSVWHEVREQILPPGEYYNRHDAWFVITQLREYEKQHILWIQVERDGLVRVFVGKNRNAIRSQGFVFDYRKQTEWQETASAYWGGPIWAPKDMKVPERK